MVELVDKLYKKVIPNKGINKTTYPDFKDNYYHQADLLFLPHDNSYKYALVVVDVGSRLVDARPLKTKQAKEIIAAFKNIYKGNILKSPTNVISVDSGTEFKGDVKKYFENDLHIFVKVAKPNRHSQQAIVERKNKDIGKQLFRRMTKAELLTGSVSKRWTDYLKDVIHNINSTTKRTRKRLIDKKPDLEYKCKGDACNILSEGTKVRVALDAPRNVYDKKRLIGKFRETDIRWNPKPTIIKKSLLAPGSVPMYLVADSDGETDYDVAYTKNQLQKVSKSEIRPKESDILPEYDDDEEYWHVEKILDRKRIKNVIYYEVKWKGFKETTWEKRSKLKIDVPDLVLEYEKNN